MNKETYGEIYLILEKMGKEYIDKIPVNIYNEIIDNIPEEIDKNKKISKDAVAFIAGLHYKYWTKSEEEKQEMLKIFKENQEKQEEKYSVNNMFERDKKIYDDLEENIEIKQQEKNSLMKVEKWYEKILNLFKKIFKIRGKRN